MRVSIWVTILVAAVVLVAVTLVGRMFINPNLPLITRAAFSLETITPNADGDADITELDYSISRNATISLTLEASDGTVYVFRQDEPRIAADYKVAFSGVVDGYTLSDDTFTGTIERRLVQNGTYTWRLRAVDAATGETAEESGTLVVSDAASQLPEIMGFTLDRHEFSPNQDGIADRVIMNLNLTKAVDSLNVYLVGADGQSIFIPEILGGRKPGEAGQHFFDYDGGIERGVEPPADGEYTVIAVAQDLEGQRTSQTSKLAINSGGVPQAEIAPQPNGVDVTFASQPFDEKYSLSQSGELLPSPVFASDLGFSSITMPVGDMLVFKLTIRNYGKVAIRTSGPWPGTVYQSDEVWGATGVYEQSGSFRVGIMCSTSETNWPWRWAIGSPESLMTETDPQNGNTYYYLPAGEQSEVWGAVRMTQLIKARNPQQCWAGLIHEDVAVVNQRVGARDITLVEMGTEADS
ncbi:MAG: hypothetical protein LCI00_00820 [Chloroflexi bacterium]|nr:hypothetical protein [Chloroflexota bacterium]MCC6896973.1 hypothetical protein [Anaerolineae bacterium]